MTVRDGAKLDQSPSPPITVLERPDGRAGAAR